MMLTPTPVPLCRNSPFPIVRSTIGAEAVAQDVSAAIVRSMIDAEAVAQDVSAAIVRDEVDAGATSEEDASVPQSQQKVRVCRFFLNGANCRFGGDCRFLHSWWSGTDDLFLAMALEGHRKPITGIARPLGYKYMFSSCIQTVKIWDPESAQRVGIINPFHPGCDRGCRIGCLVGDGAWALLGVTGAVKALNPQTGVDLSLVFPGGRQVYALVLSSANDEELLFAGLSTGSILVWNWDPQANTFQRVPGVRSSCLSQAHIGAIRTLVVGKEFLYSGSMDHTIRVWDLKTLLCVQTLTDHLDAVTSIICWGKYLLSGSLDGTVRVWSAKVDSEKFCHRFQFAANTCEFESIYMHKQEARVVALCGMFNSRGRPVLMCSCDDFCVYLYHLPSFVEVGRIFSGDEIRHIAIGQDGLFFTGNASGELKAWKWKIGD